MVLWETWIKLKLLFAFFLPKIFNFNQTNVGLLTTDMFPVDMCWDGDQWCSSAESNNSSASGERGDWIILWHNQTRSKCCSFCQCCLVTDKQCWVWILLGDYRPYTSTFNRQTCSVSWLINKQNWQGALNATQLVGAAGRSSSLIIFLYKCMLKLKSLNRLLSSISAVLTQWIKMERK